MTSLTSNIVRELKYLKILILNDLYYILSILNLLLLYHKHIFVIINAKVSLESLLSGAISILNMTPRERVLSILQGKKPDRIPWFGDLDYWFTYLLKEGLLPERYKGDGIYQLHKDLGVGFYLQGYFPYKSVSEKVRIETIVQGDVEITEIKTPVGILRQIRKYLTGSYTWAIKEHYIKDWKDLKALRYWYENTYFEPDYSLAQRRYELVGDNGIVLCYLPRSPIMEMVVSLAGIETVTYMISDNRDEFEETLVILEKKFDEAAQIALNSPAECLMIPENLSSELIGKNIFESYVRRYEEKWVQKINEAGKYSFVHIDGTLKGLINKVASVGFKVLEALTPAPVGDIAMNEIHKWIEGDNIIWGGIPGVYFTDIVSDKNFDQFVIEVLEIMKTQPRYVLGVADQVPPRSRWERIKRVSELVERYGVYS